MYIYICIYIYYITYIYIYIYSYIFIYIYIEKWCFSKNYVISPKGTHHWISRSEKDPTRRVGVGGLDDLAVKTLAPAHLDGGVGQDPLVRGIVGPLCHLSLRAQRVSERRSNQQRNLKFAHEDGVCQKHVERKSRQTIWWDHRNNDWVSSQYQYHRINTCRNINYNETFYYFVPSMSMQFYYQCCMLLIVLSPCKYWTYVYEFTTLTHLHPVQVPM